MAKTNFKSIDDYIKSVPEQAKAKLEEIRQLMHEAAPEAEESISYQIPTFKLNGKFVGYFAGYAKHVSLYPIPRDDEELIKEVSPYVAGKGTMHFPIDKPLPKELIIKVVKYWVEFRRGKSK